MTLLHKIVSIIIIASIASAGIIGTVVYATSSPGAAYSSPTDQAQTPSSQHGLITVNTPITISSTDQSLTKCKMPDSDLAPSDSTDDETIAGLSSSASSAPTSPQPFTTIIIPNTGCLQHIHPHCGGTFNMHVHKHNGRHALCHRDQD